MPADYQRLHVDLNRTLGRTQLANSTPAPIVADIISSKAPPLPKEVAEGILNENRNRLVRTAINASRADPVLASALENAFTALSKVESNASYKTILHRRRMLTLWAIIIDNVTDGQVKGEDVWVVQGHARRLLHAILRGRDGKSPIKASMHRPSAVSLLISFIASQNTPKTQMATAAAWHCSLEEAFLKC